MLVMMGPTTAKQLHMMPRRGRTIITPETLKNSFNSSSKKPGVFPLLWWVGGWGPRYLASKRERGPVRVPSSLTEDEWGRPLMSSFWNHERTWLRLTP